MCVGVCVSVYDVYQKSNIYTFIRLKYNNRKQTNIIGKRNKNNKIDKYSSSVKCGP